jgi:hypothetical protein
LLIIDHSRELARDSGIIPAIAKFLLGRSTEVGSRTLVHAASQGEETHGKYLEDCKIGETVPWIRSEEGEQVQSRVWDELLQKLEKIKPGISSNF